MTSSSSSSSSSPAQPVCLIGGTHDTLRHVCSFLDFKGLDNLARTCKDVCKTVLDRLSNKVCSISSSLSLRSVGYSLVSKEGGCFGITLEFFRGGVRSSMDLSNVNGVITAAVPYRDQHHAEPLQITERRDDYQPVLDVFDAKTNFFESFRNFLMSPDKSSDRQKLLVSMAVSLIKDQEVPKVEQALQIIKEKIENKNDAFRKVIKALAEKGDPESLDKALEIIEKNIQSSVSKDVALADVVKALAQKGDIDKALEVTQQMNNDYDLKDSALQNVVEALVQEGDIDKALEIIEQMDDASSKDSALWDVVKEVAQKGDKKGLDQLLESVGKESDRYYKSAAFGELVKALAQKGDRASIAEALGITQQMDSGSSKDSVLCHVVKALAQKGDIDKALEITQQIGNDYLKQDTLLQIVKALAEKGDIDKALGIIEKNAQEGHNLTYDSVIELVKAFAQKGDEKDLDRLLEITGKQYDPLFKELVFNEVVKALTEKGDIDKALEIIEEKIGPTLDKNKAFKEVVKALTEKGDQESLDKALQIIEEKIEGTFDIEGTLEKDSALADVVKALTEKGDQESLDKALEITQRINDNFLKNKALSHVLNLLLEQGKMSEILRLTALGKIQPSEDLMNRLYLSVILNDKTDLSLAEKIPLPLSFVLDQL